MLVMVGWYIFWVGFYRCFLRGVYTVIPIVAHRCGGCGVCYCQKSFIL